MIENITKFHWQIHIFHREQFIRANWLQIDSRTEIDSELGDAKSFILRIFSLLTRKCVQRTVHNCA